MVELETRELKYFVAIAEELHVGRAAEKLGMSQPPLSRALGKMEHRLGVQLFTRTPRGVELTPAGVVLLAEARAILAAMGAATRRTRLAHLPTSLVLVTKAGASHSVLRQLLDAIGDRADAPRVEIRMCEVGEQAGLLRAGHADMAVMHRPVDDVAGFATVDLVTESQVAVVPKRHRLASRTSITLAEAASCVDLPMARWPRLDGTYPDGPGPEIRTQSQIAHLVALGKALLVIPESSRAWQWPDHVSVPVADAMPVTTVLAWRDPGSDAVTTVVDIVTALGDLSDAVTAQAGTR